MLTVLYCSSLEIAHFEHTAVHFDVCQSGQSAQRAISAWPGQPSLARPAWPGLTSQAGPRPGHGAPGRPTFFLTVEKTSWAQLFFKLEKKLASTFFSGFRKKIGHLALPEGPKGHFAFFGRASRAGGGKNFKIEPSGSQLFF